jgi:hypothetical protein
MRDFTNGGDINGDVTITESNPNGYMKFEDMNVEQLQHSLNHHSNLAREERANNNVFSYVLLGIALFVAFFLSVWYLINGNINNSMFLLGVVGIGVPIFGALKNSEHQSIFERRQINTINYLATLIRERR